MRRAIACLVVSVLLVCLAACVNAERRGARLDAAEVMAATAAARFVAHRGLRVSPTGVVAVENTREAFANAADTPTIWGIETDVWQTADGVLVCMHDCDAVSGIDNVHEATADTVLHTPLRVSADAYAPTFDDYLAECKRGSKTAVVELKDADMTTACMDAVLAAIRQTDVDAVVISFYYTKLAYVRATAPTMPCMLLFSRGYRQKYRRTGGGRIGRDELLQMALDNRISLSVDSGYLCRSGALRRWVQRFEEAGLPTGVWTVDDVHAAAYELTEWGVSMLTSNIDMATAIAAAYGCD